MKVLLGLPWWELVTTVWMTLLSSLVNCSQPRVNTCVLRCKDNHMVEMENEWSMDFALPLLSLLRSTGDEAAAYAKAKLICQSNDALEGCLRSCADSIEAKILLIGLAPWKSTCANLDALRRQFPCWREQSAALSGGCGHETVLVRDSFGFFASNGSVAAVAQVCNEFDRFAACMVSEYSKLCGAAAEESTARMFSASKLAIKHMLQLKWAQLPKTCSRDFVRRDTSAEFLAALNGAGVSLSLLSLLMLFPH